MPMQMMEGGAAGGYPMDMMDIGPPPPHAGYGGMGPGEMMNAGMPGPQQHARMMTPQQQQRIGGHMMNSADMMGHSAPPDQMSPWFDGDM